MKTLIEEEKLNVNSAGKEKETALHFAAKKGNLKIIEFLLSHGANPNARTDPPDYMYDGMVEFQTPLIRAIQYGNLDVLKYFHKKGFLVEDPKLNLHAQCLKVAIRKRQFEVVKFLCSEVGISPDATETNTIFPGSGRSGFTAAASAGLIDYMRYFLSIGCNVNALSAKHDTHCKESTPLIFALSMNHTEHKAIVEVVKFLINEAKVDVNICNGEGFSPICICVARVPECFDFLLSSGANFFGGTHSLMVAAIDSGSRSDSDGSVEMVLKCYELGANPLMYFSEKRYRFTTLNWLLQTQE